MHQYDGKPQEVPLTLTPAELRALLALANGIDYGDPVVKAAARKLKAAQGGKA